MDLALEHQARDSQPLSCAFSVNMAQNMYKWAGMAARAGWRAELIPHMLDHSALSAPEWEEFRR